MASSDHRLKKKKKMGLWLQAGPEHIFPLRVCDAFHPFSPPAPPGDAKGEQRPHTRHEHFALIPLCSASPSLLCTRAFPDTTPEKALPKRRATSSLGHPAQQC